MGTTQSKRKSVKRNSKTFLRNQNNDNGCCNVISHHHHHHHHHYHHHLKDPFIPESSSSSVSSTSGRSSADSRAPLDGQTILLPAGDYTSLPAAVPRETRGTDVNEERASPKDVTDSLVTIRGRSRRHEETGDDDGRRRKSDDDDAKEGVTTSIEVMSLTLADYECHRIGEEVEQKKIDAKEKESKKNIRLRRIGNENIDRTTQERIRPGKRQKEKENEERMKEKEREERKKEALENGGEGGGETDVDKNYQRAEESEAEMERTSHPASFCFNDELLAELILQNMIKNNIFINSHRRRLSEAIVCDKEKRGKRFAGRHGNLVRADVTDDGSHGCVTRIYLKHSVDDDVDAKKKRWTSVQHYRFSSGAKCPLVDLRIVHSHGDGCCAFLDGGDSTLPFQRDVGRHRDVRPEVMSSRHYWHRHRFRDRSQRRAMERVAEWINAESMERLKISGSHCTRS